jgi:hypothetical protein
MILMISIPSRILINTKMPTAKLSMFAERNKVIAYGLGTPLLF